MDIKLNIPKLSEIPEQFRIQIPYVQKEYLVDGEIKNWETNFEEVASPVYFIDQNGNTTNIIGKYPKLTAKESLVALDAAVRAFDNGKGEWVKMGVESRIKHMLRFMELMKQKRNEIVNLLMWEIGKNLADSQKEFDRTVEYIIDTIESLKELDRTASRFLISEGIISQVRRAPLGVVLCMGPFNYPLNETFTTLIPALLMGNTVIFKPPKLGVLLHRPLLEAFRDAFPKGVVNTVYGDGAEVVGPLMESGKIDVLAFIGSSRVADILKKQHPKPHRLRGVLGLEAKNPAIILPDADIDNAVEECITGSLSFNGQRCTAIKMIFVHKSIADEFLKKFTDKISNLKLGLPWEQGVRITPLPETGKSEYLQSLIEDAKKLGGKVINSDGGKFDKTLFFPAVLFPVNEQMRAFKEEQFGPLIPITTFENLNEPLHFIETSNYGQQAAVFGKNTNQIADVTDVLVNQVCRVNINSQCQRGPDVLPFTGRKDSAEGTLSVSDALRVFSIRTLFAVKENEMNKQIVTEITKEHKSNFLSTDFLL